MTNRSYSIEFAPRVAKQLAKIPKAIRNKIFDRIEKLKKNPRPPKVEPLQGSESGFFRVRQGDYRIVYTIKDDRLLVLVVRIAHRKEVYTKKHSS